MRRLAAIALPVALVPLALLLTPGTAAAVRARHALPAKCARGSHTLIADSQAQVYAARETALGYVTIRACAFGQRRSVLLSGCDNEEAATTCANNDHVTLAGAYVAYELADSSSGKYPESEKEVHEWFVVVRNLRTGRVLHDVPTGTPLESRPHYVGVGAIVALVLETDGSVAWIAEDYMRSATPHGTGPPYFDVYEAGATGTRLLASGTAVDPSSLALAVGISGVRGGGGSSGVAGSTVYWTREGKPESAPLE
jgi:hypothetical protein